jgi:hypothetical protein
MGCRACAGCWRIDYCSTECQKADWSIHKHFCKQLDNRLASFKDCPKQAATISQRIDTAENYLSRERELRISNLFINSLSYLQERMRGIEWEEKETMLGLCGRYESLLSRIGDAVKTGRVCSDEKNYDFLCEYKKLCVNFFIHVPSKYCSSQEHVQNLQKAICIIPIQLSTTGPQTLSADMVAAEIECFIDISNAYLLAGDCGTALNSMEFAYTLRTRCFTSGEQLMFQTITCGLCKLLSMKGDHERMLDLLKAALLNIEANPLNANDRDMYRDSLCSVLYLASKAAMICACALPLDDCNRTSALKAASGLITKCLETRFRCAASSPGSHNHNCLLEAVLPETIPLGTEFDFNHCLDQLTELLRTSMIHIISTGYHIQATFEVVKDLISVLRYILRRLQSGLTRPSSVDWDNVIVVINSLRMLHIPARKDPAKIKRDLAEVERCGAYNDEARLLRGALVIYEMQVFVEEAEGSVMADLPSYKPGFIGPRNLDPNPSFSASPAHPPAGNGDGGETRTER